MSVGKHNTGFLEHEMAVDMLLRQPRGYRSDYIMFRGGFDAALRTLYHITPAITANLDFVRQIYQRVTCDIDFACKTEAVYVTRKSGSIKLPSRKKIRGIYSGGVNLPTRGLPFYAYCAHCQQGSAVDHAPLPLSCCPPVEKQKR